MSQRARGLLVVAAVLLGGYGGRFAFILWRYPADGVGDNLLAALAADFTRYAPTYTESGFLAVVRGMPADEVRKLLGEPLKTVEHPAQSRMTWIYSEPTTDSNFRIRAVVFTNGRVSDVVSSYYFD
jgi:hypothetical protein